MERGKMVAYARVYEPVSKVNMIQYHREPAHAGNVWTHGMTKKVCAARAMIFARSTIRWVLTLSLSQYEMLELLLPEVLLVQAAPNPCICDVPECFRLSMHAW